MHTGMDVAPGYNGTVTKLIALCFPNSNMSIHLVLAPMIERTNTMVDPTRQFTQCNNGQSVESDSCSCQSSREEACRSAKDDEKVLHVFPRRKAGEPKKTRYQTRLEKNEAVALTRNSVERFFGYPMNQAADMMVGPSAQSSLKSMPYPPCIVYCVGGP